MEERQILGEVPLPVHPHLRQQGHRLHVRGGRPRRGPDGGTSLPAAIAAAEKAVVDTRDLQSRRGPASWLQERSIGLQDPGATAMWWFLQCWQTAAASTKVAS